MIHGTYGSNIDTYLTLEEKRIDTAKAMSRIQYLCKFTNDMTKTIKYVYGNKIRHNERSVHLQFIHNTTDAIYSKRINFKPYGYWSYDIYEVSWVDTPDISEGRAPTTESEVLEVEDGNGVVQGKVESGKVYITETSGSEQIKYTEHTESTTNYLYAN